MSEYVPTTEQVRDGYAIDPEAEYRNPVDAPWQEQENRRAFNRWLERVRAEERERCAQIAERHPIPFNAVAQYPVRAGIAAAIRVVSAEQEDHHG